MSINQTIIERPWTPPTTPGKVPYAVALPVAIVGPFVMLAIGVAAAKDGAFIILPLTVIAALHIGLLGFALVAGRKIRLAKHRAAIAAEISEATGCPVDADDLLAAASRRGEGKYSVGHPENGTSVVITLHRGTVRAETQVSIA